MSRAGNLAALFFLTLLSACGGGGGAGPDDEPVVLNTPDEVVEALRIGYESKDDAKYGAVLAADFTFYFSPNDVDFWKLPESWGRAEEILCSRNVFTGQSGFRPGPTPQAPVDIRFTFGLQFVPVDAEWTESTWVDAAFAGKLTRTYESIMIAQYTSTDFDFIGGRQQFFLELEDTENADGTAAKRWIISAWRDLGQPNPALRHGTFSWGYFKAIYAEGSAP